MMQGTSMACPHVSGVAALIVSKCGGPGFTRSMLWNRIVNTTKDISSVNRNNYVGTGLVDVLAAITAGGTIPPAAVTDFSASLINADRIRFSLTVPADEDDTKAYGINIYYSKQPITETTMLPYKSFATESLQAGDLMEGIMTGLDFETQYYLVCEAYDRIGNKSPMSSSVTVTTGPNHAPVITTEDALTFGIPSTMVLQILPTTRSLFRQDRNPNTSTVVRLRSPCSASMVPTFTTTLPYLLPFRMQAQP